MTLGDAANSSRGQLGQPGHDRFCTRNISALMQVPDAGGTPQPLTHLGKRESTHRWPEYLPGGKAVLFAAASTTTNSTDAQVAVQSVGTGERRNLVQGGMNPRYAPSGHLVYAQGGSLMAVPFDPRRLTVTGTAVPVVESVLQFPFSGDAQYSISATGSLIYVAGGIQSSQSKLVWVNRSGAEQPLTAPTHAYLSPRVSPDGKRVAMANHGIGSNLALQPFSGDIDPVDV